MNKTIKRRVRWDRVAFLLIALVVLMSFAVNALAEDSPLICDNVTVAAGDTLWGLIKEVNPDYCGNMNAAVYQTCKLNNMPTAQINVGQSILIPKL